MLMHGNFPLLFHLHHHYVGSSRSVSHSEIVSSSPTMMNRFKCLGASVIFMRRKRIREHVRARAKEKSDKEQVRAREGKKGLEKERKRESRRGNEGTRETKRREKEKG